MISSRTTSVTLEINSGDTSAPYTSAKWALISRVVIPRAYNDKIMSLIGS
jgi:hypothetical protein